MKLHDLLLSGARRARRRALVKISRRYGPYGPVCDFRIVRVGHKTAETDDEDYLRESLAELLSDVDYEEGWYEPSYALDYESREMPCLVLDRLKPANYDRAAKAAYRATKPKT